MGNNDIKNAKHDEMYKQLKEDGYVIFETVVGSQAHGTATPKSDVDIMFVYIAPPKEWLYTHTYDYEPFLKTDKDKVGYELEYFLRLCTKNNPSMLELLFAPEDCYILKHEVYDVLIERKEEFLSKVCCSSIFGYATSQIKKATGMQKMQNWEKDRTEKKSQLDFCYVITEGYKTRTLKEYIKEKGLSLDNMGLVNIPHAKNSFAIFYDRNKEFRFKGIGFDGMGRLHTSSIPKGMEPIATMSYNMDAYNVHKKEYKQYEQWKESANRDRWVETDNGEFIDAKNTAHLVRLTQMNYEIATGKGMNVRRPNPEELLSIRRGEKNLEEIIAWAEEQEPVIKKLYAESDLPDKVDPQTIRDLTRDMRELFYVHEEKEDRFKDVKIYENKYLELIT